MGVAHLALDLGLGDEGGDGVDDDHIDRVGADEQLADLEGLLARVGLADEQVVDVDAELAGPGRVERVLGVDERRDAAGLLGAGDHGERQRGLTGRFGAEDLDDPPAGDAAPAQREVEREGAGRDAGDRQVRVFVETHDRALPKDFSICPRAHDRARLAEGSAGTS
jgi:hypothetical protein